jgi:hypothetical protein
LARPEARGGGVGRWEGNKKERERVVGKVAGDECVFILGEGPGWQMRSGTDTIPDAAGSHHVIHRCIFNRLAHMRALTKVSLSRTATIDSPLNGPMVVNLRFSAPKPRTSTRVKGEQGKGENLNSQTKPGPHPSSFLPSPWLARRCEFPPA